MLPIRSVPRSNMRCFQTTTFVARTLSLIGATLVASLSGCGEVWTDPLSTPSQYDKGLIVMYPGALGSDSEMLGFYTTLRLAGIDQAIEVPQWTAPVSYGTDGAAAYAQHK